MVGIEGKCLLVALSTLQEHSRRTEALALDTELETEAFCRLA